MKAFHIAMFAEEPLTKADVWVCDHEAMVDRRLNRLLSAMGDGRPWHTAGELLHKLCDICCMLHAVWCITVCCTLHAARAMLCTVCCALYAV